MNHSGEVVEGKSGQSGDFSSSNPEHESVPVDPLELGLYEEILLQLGRLDKVDDIRFIIDSLKVPQVLHEETWHNLNVLDQYVEGIAYDELVDRSVRLALDATKTQYQLQVSESLKTLNGIVTIYPGLYGVRTHQGIDYFQDFSAVYDEQAHTASLVLQTEGGNIHDAVDRRRLAVNVAHLVDPTEVEAIDRFRRGDPV